jgi:hypothetical protein
MDHLHSFQPETSHPQTYRLRDEDVLSCCMLAANANEALVLALTAEAQEKMDHRKLPRPGKTNKTGRPVYSESTWGRMMERDIERLRDPKSDEAKVFMRRFRIAFGLFEHILGWVRCWVAETRKSDCDVTGRDAVPLNLLLLGVLRMLGRGTCTDGITELSDISETKMNSFFKAFCS